MSTTATVTADVKPKTTKLYLHSYDGLTSRDVSTNPPRDCTSDEVPIIDLSGLNGDLEAREKIAKNLLFAAETTGFFYINNHGVPDEIIERCLAKSKQFFQLPIELKMRAVNKAEISGYGYQPTGSRHVNPASSRDRKETWSFHYEPRLDPLRDGSSSPVPQSVLEIIPKDAHIWNDVGLPGFPDDILAYYQAVVTLARQMIGIVALALDLPENHFDDLVKYPGADCAMNFYPGHGDVPIADPEEVGLGAHTDLQVLTFLYQSDDDKGLQVLNANKEWVYAPPKPGTFVVNIGDFLMRLTNDRLKSTVHRVIQHSKNDRYSMPVFFGFDFRAKLGVLPSCISEENPAKYEPATIGELIHKRLNDGIDKKA